MSDYWWHISDEDWKRLKAKAIKQIIEKGLAEGEKGTPAAELLLLKPLALARIENRASILDRMGNRVKVVYARFLAMFAFFAFAFRNADFEINGTKVPAMLLSAVVILAWQGLLS